MTHAASLTAPAVAAETRGSDYADLMRRIRGAGLLDRRHAYYFTKIGVMAGLLLGGWALFAVTGDSWWQIAVAVLLAFVFAQLGFIGHDAGHGQIFRTKRANYLVGLLHGNLAIGLSYGWWVDKHNRHHSHPNEEGRDPDVAVGALAFTDRQVGVKRGLLRFITRYQAFLFFPLTLLEGLQLHVASVRALSRRGLRYRAGEAALLLVHAAFYFTAVLLVLPPVKALGSRYVGVMYKPRVAAETSTYWRLVGAVDGTVLNWSSAVGGPAMINAGQEVTFQTGTPFTVQSQDADHPFMLFTYMTSSTAVSSGYGDPDFVTSVPPEQYLRQYVFFTDPTYPETNLVVVRARGTDNQFHDVTLDCGGALTGWTPVGTDYEYTRKDLSTGNFTAVGQCDNGRHEMKSDAPFGLWVWGWGTPLTSTFTQNVSYGYPGGMNVAPINTVIF